MSRTEQGQRGTGGPVSNIHRMAELGDRGQDLCNALLLAVMVLAIFAQVVARYLFEHALPWPEELGRFLFAWIVFLGIVSVVRADEMLSLDLVYRWLPEKIGRALSLLVSLACLGLLLVILKGGYELMVRQSSQISTAMEVPMWIVYLVIPLGTLLMAVAMLLKIVGQCRALLIRQVHDKETTSG